MSKASLRRPTAHLELTEADRIELGFVAGDLPQAQSALVDAAGLPARFQDERESVGRFRLVCELNARQLGRAWVERVQPRLSAALAVPRGKQADWDTLVELLWRSVQSALTDIGVAVPEAAEWTGDLADEALMLAYAIEGPRPAWIASHGAAAVELVEAYLVRDLAGAPPSLAELARWRRERFADLDAVIASRVGVEVARIDWATKPSNLAGGYLRALGWMWRDAPACVARWLDPDYFEPEGAAESPAGEGAGA